MVAASAPPEATTAPGRDRRADVGEPADDPDPADRERSGLPTKAARGTLRVVRQLLGPSDSASTGFCSIACAPARRLSSERSKPALSRSLTAFCKPLRSWKTPTASRTRGSLGSLGHLGYLGRVHRRPPRLWAPGHRRTRRARGGCPRAAPIMRQKPAVGQRKTQIDARAPGQLEPGALSRSPEEAPTRPRGRGRRPGAAARPPEIAGGL